MPSFSDEDKKKLARVFVSIWQLATMALMNANQETDHDLTQDACIVAERLASEVAELVKNG